MSGKNENKKATRSLFDLEIFSKKPDMNDGESKEKTAVQNPETSSNRKEGNKRHQKLVSLGEPTRPLDQNPHVRELISTLDRISKSGVFLKQEQEDTGAVITEPCDVTKPDDFARSHETNRSREPCERVGESFESVSESQILCNGQKSLFDRPAQDGRTPILQSTSTVRTANLKNDPNEQSPHGSTENLSGQSMQDSECDENTDDLIHQVVHEKSKSKSSSSTTDSQLTKREVAKVDKEMVLPTNKQKQKDSQDENKEGIFPATKNEQEKSLDENQKDIPPPKNVQISKREECLDEEIQEEGACGGEGASKLVAVKPPRVIRNPRLIRHSGQKRRKSVNDWWMLSDKEKIDRLPPSRTSQTDQNSGIHLQSVVTDRTDSLLGQPSFRTNKRPETDQNTRSPLQSTEEVSEEVEGQSSSKNKKRPRIYPNAESPLQSVETQGNISDISNFSEEADGLPPSKKSRTGLHRPSSAHLAQTSDDVSKVTSAAKNSPIKIQIIDSDEELPSKKSRTVLLQPSSPQLAQTSDDVSKVTCAAKDSPIEIIDSDEELPENKHQIMKDFTDPNSSKNVQESNHQNIKHLLESRLKDMNDVNERNNQKKSDASSHDCSASGEVLEDKRPAGDWQNIKQQEAQESVKCGSSTSHNANSNNSNAHFSGVLGKELEHNSKDNHENKQERKNGELRSGDHEVKDDLLTDSSKECGDESSIVKEQKNSAEGEHEEDQLSESPETKFFAKMASHLNLQATVIVRAKKLVRRASTLDLGKGRGRSTLRWLMSTDGKKVLWIACLCLACRQEGCPRSFHELANLTGRKKKDIGHCFKLLVEFLKVNPGYMSTKDFVVRYSSLLRLNDEDTRRAINMAEKIENYAHSASSGEDIDVKERKQICFVRKSLSPMSNALVSTFMAANSVKSKSNLAFLVSDLSTICDRNEKTLSNELGLLFRVVSMTPEQCVVFGLGKFYKLKGGIWPSTR